MANKINPKLPKKTDRSKAYFEPDTLEIRQLKEHISAKQTLTKEEILWLFRKAHHRRTTEDIQKLVDGNLAMVYSVVVKRLNYHYSINPKYSVGFMDAFNAGVLGLYKAVERFDSTRNYKFSTFAYSYIENEVREEIKKHVYPLKTYSYAKVSRTDFDECIEEYDSGTDTEAFYSDMGHKDVAETMLNVLEGHQKEIFILFHIKSYPVGDIAVQLNLTKSTIYYHMEQLKKKIREELPELRDLLKK